MVRRTYKLAADIAGRLKEARTSSGMTVRELAHAANLDKNSVSDIELGRVRNPGVGTIADLARALQVDPRWLAYGLAKPVRG